MSETSGRAAGADGHGDGAPHLEDYELPIEGFKGTPDEIERQWFEKCYKGRGDTIAQLTLRAVLMGSVLGGVLALTNIYIGLKAGWGFGVAITACILSYAIWTAFHKIGLARTPMTILENNCMQSTASSAGYSTGGTLISAFAAYILLNNATLPLPLMLGWVFFLAVLGVTMAIPMKRQMINIEQLRFPSGVAAAETLKALHSHGSAGLRSARALGIAGLLAALSKFWTEGLVLISSSLANFQIGAWVTSLNKAVVGTAWMGRTVMFSWEPLFIAAGAITGLRVCASMLVGGVLCWMVFVPVFLDQNVITLTVSERVASIPQTLADENGERIKKYLTINRTDGSLKWEGIMTPEDRDLLLSKADDPGYRTAIERLFVRSQFRASTPLASLPAGLKLDGEISALLSYDSGRQALIMPDIAGPKALSKLRAASGDREFQSAVDALYARSSLPSFEPLWSAADLEKLPHGMDIPPLLGQRLVHDRKAKKLLWRGPLDSATLDMLNALSTDSAYRAAVASLATAAGQRGLSEPVPADLAESVQFDAEHAALRAAGPLSGDALKVWKESAKDDAALTRAIEGLATASVAARASENFRDLVAWTLWGGTACMVSSGLLAFALQWKTALRAFSGLFALFGAGRRKGRDELDALETPSSWFVGGQLVSLVAIAWLAHYSFGMPYWQSALAVLMTFGLALVACRVTGETDTTPIGAMGKIMQLTFGVVHPAKIAGDVGAMNVNLMAANITAGAAGSSADLLTDLKSGYLLGAHPRKQFIAQFCGIFAGTLVTVFAFRLLVPDASVLGSAQFPAPAAQTWKGVAEALSQGLGALAPLKLWSILIGGSVGILLPILSMISSKRAQPWIPSAAGVGLAWVFNWYYALLFFLGAVIGSFIEKRYPAAAKEYTFPVASGIIAGESLMGVVLIFWENGPEMLHKLFGAG